MNFFDARVVAAAIVAIAAAPCAAAVPDVQYSDPICPEAAARVTAVRALSTATPPQAVYDATQAAADAFDICAKRKLGNQDIEPGAHYANLRAAQFSYLAARALARLQRTDEARRELQEARRRAADVAAWETSVHGVDPGVAVQSSNNRASRFKPDADALVASIGSELATLGASAAPLRTAAPTPSP